MVFSLVYFDRMNYEVVMANFLNVIKKEKGSFYFLNLLQELATNCSLGLVFLHVSITMQVTISFINPYK